MSKNDDLMAARERAIRRAEELRDPEAAQGKGPCCFGCGCLLSGHRVFADLVLMPRRIEKTAIIGQPRIGVQTPCILPWCAPCAESIMGDVAAVFRAGMVELWKRRVAGIGGDESSIEGDESDGEAPAQE